MPGNFIRLAAMSLLALSCGACATTGPAAQAGFLKSYQGLEPRKNAVRAQVLQRRDETRISAIEHVWIAPVENRHDGKDMVGEHEVGLVLTEVDRQVCYELSKRFTLLSEPRPDVAVVRVAVTRVRPTNLAGSAAAAVANAFVPGPISLRAPGSVGGLWAEAELISSDGAQAAAIVWRREAMVVGTDKPSLSVIGDAHQLAEPFGDTVAKAFAAEGRAPRAVATPDPCARFGPRLRPEGMIVRMATGLYQPELSGARAPSVSTSERR